MFNTEVVRIREEEKFVVRLPPGMRARIADEAKVSKRSMNSEIINRMESSLDLEREVTRLKAVIDALLGQPSEIKSAHTNEAGH
ncbi:MAG TPA: Arc family DNA-binding protein [Pseudomonas sp.]|uniref:Arc family DNA-binding protein n=1 Tax=Pseudomonas sp. TaxID=306 RepID=UPI002ED81FF3